MIFKGLTPPYDVLVVDPPHHFDTFAETGVAKSPQAHYETMDVHEICTLPVREIMARRAIVFVWCTWPALARGDVHIWLRAWGLAGKTGGAWVKRTSSGKMGFGPGYIWRTACEPIIVATREKETARIRGTRWRNCLETFESFDFDGLAREHSRKPDEFYSTVEALTPGARRVDLFARAKRPGWDSWGREARKFNRSTSR